MPRYKRGSGSIYKKKGNRMWWLSYYAEGRHICESSGTRDRTKARERLQQRIGQIAEGTFVGNRPDRVTYDEMAKDFLNDYQINAKKSYKDAERSARTLEKYFHGRKAQSITTADIADYISGRKKMDWKIARSTENFPLFGGCLILLFSAERSSASRMFQCWRKTISEKGFLSGRILNRFGPNSLNI